jgi:hypothetical protein
MTPALTLPTNADRFFDFAARADLLAVVVADVRRVIAEDEQMLTEWEELYEKMCAADDLGAYVEDYVVQFWGMVCRQVAVAPEMMAIARKGWGVPRRELVRQTLRRTERLVDLLRTMAVVWEELDLETPDDIREVVWTIRISPLAYLRAMWNLFWSSTRHPFSETVIELKTGRVLRTQ